MSYLCPDLPHGVAVPQSGCMWRLVNSVKVNRDAERDAYLIRPGVASPDGARGVIHLVRHSIFGQSISCDRMTPKKKNKMI